MDRLARRCAGAALAASVVLLGCARGVATRWEADASRICAEKTCFRVGALPTGFRVVLREEGAVGFLDPALGAVVAGKATCRDDADASPLSSLTNQMLVGYTDRTVVRAERVDMAGREALHSVVSARLDGVPVILELYVLKRDGCIYDLSFVAPPDRYEVGRPAFARFVEGFAPESRRS